MSCGKQIEVYVGKWHHRKVTVNCGNTSPTGYPWQCDVCRIKNAHRDWRLEAEEAGEQWDEDY